MFTPFRLREMTLHNRVVVSPMDMYSATAGTPNDFHLVHLGAARDLDADVRERRHDRLRPLGLIAKEADEVVRTNDSQRAAPRARSMRRAPPATPPRAATRTGSRSSS